MVVAGVERPDFGQVRWRRAPLDAGYRRCFGYIPEERGPYPKMRAHDQFVHLVRLRGVEVQKSRKAWHRARS